VLSVSHVCTFIIKSDMMFWHTTSCRWRYQ